MFYNLRLSARWVYWLCIAAFFGFGVSRLPSWYGYIGVPFIYAVYLLLPAFFIFLFSFVKSLAAVRREKRTGRGAPDYPVLTINYFIREAFGVTHLWVFGW